MLPNKATTAFLVFLFFQAITTSNINQEGLDACSANSLQFVDPAAAIGAVDLIKTQIISNSEAKQALLSDSTGFEAVKQKLIKCTEELMRKNQFKALEKLIEDVLDPLDLDLSTEMRLVGNSIKKEIDNIVNVAHAKRNTQTVSPVFQWVQSKSNVFLQVKFAHRHDAPGCLEVKNAKVDFTQNGLYFSAFGVQAQQPIQFVLNLTFYGDIAPEECSWNLESVGRMFINVTKATPEVWVSLLKNNEKLPQMRLWWEMKDVYSNDMKEYDRLNEELEDRESGRRKGKKSKSQAAEGDEKQAEQPAIVDEL